MDHYMLIWAICLYVENRVQGETDLADLALQQVFSLAHLRDIFRCRTGKTLSRYIHERKLANAAQELLHASDDIVEIAIRYGYSSRDVFSRTFRRYTGYTPSEFRRLRPLTVRVKLCAGLLGPALPQKEVDP